MANRYKNKNCVQICWAESSFRRLILHNGRPLTSWVLVLHTNGSTQILFLHQHWIVAFFLFSLIFSHEVIFQMYKCRFLSQKGHRGNLFTFISCLILYLASRVDSIFITVTAKEKHNNDSWQQNVLKYIHSKNVRIIIRTIRRSWKHLSKLWKYHFYICEKIL